MDEGFEVPRTVYRLEWDDEAYTGLVVRVQAMTIAEVLVGFAALWDLDGLDQEQRKERLREQHQLFVDHVVDWNLHDNGVPVPVTVDALRSMEGRFVGSMISAWLRNTTGVSRPLVDDSTSGDQSAVESIPMETLQESLAS